MHTLISTLTGLEYPFDRLEEFAENGESLEVAVEGIERARLRAGQQIWQRFAEFLPFRRLDPNISLGEGNTPLLEASAELKAFTGIDHLLVKNEAQNPTWSFKDRGSLTCIALARELGERVTATISTGNMGHSIAAYGARAGVQAIVIVPEFAPAEKTAPMTVHGAAVLKVVAPDYSEMKKTVLGLAKELNLRIVSGNGAVRVEGYKLTAFELFEQLGGEVPDFIAVPTSACGHIRGIFKGYRELLACGLTKRLPRMVVVQAANNSPIVSAIQQGSKHVIPFADFHTVAEAITTGNPMGGDEIIEKAYRYGWLAEKVEEEEIVEGQCRLAAAGFFVEPAAATSVFALKKLRGARRIPAGASVVMILTGAGLKDPAVSLGRARQEREVIRLDLGEVDARLEALVKTARVTT